MTSYNMWKSCIMIYGLYHYTFLGWEERNLMVLSSTILYITKIFWYMCHFGFSLGKKWKVEIVFWKAETELHWRKRITFLTFHLLFSLASPHHHWTTRFRWPIPKEIKDLCVPSLSSTMRIESETGFKLNFEDRNIWNFWDEDWTI